MAILATLSCVGCKTTAQAQVDSKPPAQTAGEVLDAPTSDPPPPTPLDETQRQQVQLFGTVLLNSSNDISPETRQGAAVQLLSMADLEAIDWLNRGLSSGEPLVIRAILGGLNGSAVPPSELLDAMVEVLQTASGDLRTSVESIVARSGEQGLNAVAAAALNTDLPVSERLGPIQSLQSFRSRAAAVKLMQLLAADRDEPAEVITAACTCLGHLTGQPHGIDATSWRTWWMEARHQSQEMWLATRVAHLTEQLGARTAQLQQEQLRREKIEGRLTETYRELFRLLPYPDGQLEALPPMLDDELSIVRIIAVGRIERMLRDAVAIPDALQQKVAERLLDANPKLRLQAARLLDQLAFEATAERIAARLTDETDPEVVAGFLQVLAGRPTIETLPGILAWINDPRIATDAAHALWGLVSTQAIPTEQITPTRDTVRNALADNTVPAAAEPLTAVLALIGNESDIAQLTTVLDGDDRVRALAVARGFAQRGLRQPLLDRSADPEIFTSVIQAIRVSPPSLADTLIVARLPVPDEHRALWTEAIVEMARGLPPTDGLSLDRTLQDERIADRAMRSSILMHMAELPPDTVPAELREQIISRLAPVLFSLDEAPRALELLEQANNTTPTIGLQTLCLQAALRCGAWDKALVFDENPASWIVILEGLDASSPGAAALQQAILERFNAQLEGDLKNRFDAISQLIPNPAAAAEGVTPPIADAPPGSADRPGEVVDATPATTSPE